MGSFQLLCFVVSAVFKQVLTSLVSSLSQCRPLRGSHSDRALDFNLESLVVLVVSLFGPVN